MNGFMEKRASLVAVRRRLVANILLIDDEEEFCEILQGQLQERGSKAHYELAAEEGLTYLAGNAADLVLLDVHLPRMSGLEFLDALAERNLRLPVIVMTSAYNDHTGIEASKRGAFKCVIKSLDYDDALRELEPIIRKALEIHSRPVPKPLSTNQAADESLIVGNSEPMRDLHTRIGLLARVDESVLILGETGTGKELVARAVYQHSRRASAAFLAINCAAIPDTLLESELFGHEKGTFTSADRRRIGKFEQCSGGTIFLDEIGDMPLALQAKMLRLLQDQRFERMGGNETLQTDVRILAATNVNLEAAVAAGRFRKDLYYRLKVFTIPLPPLRERGEDLPLLLQHFIPLFSRKLGREVSSIAPEVFQTLRRYSWPGNIRELQSVLKQALLQATGPVLLPEFLPSLIAGDNPSTTELSDKDAASTGIRNAVAWAWHSKEPNLWPLLHDLLEGELLRYALAQPGEGEVKLARRLGVSRNKLRARLEQYGLKKAADNGD